MLLFKTSGKTINAVIANQKHAFKGHPKSSESGEIILVSKNKTDCRIDEKQIQHIMFLEIIRRESDEEFEKYWPGNRGRWKYMAHCVNTVLLEKPFDLSEILEGARVRPYRYVVTFKKIEQKDEVLIKQYLKSINAIA